MPIQQKRWPFPWIANHESQCFSIFFTWVSISAYLCQQLSLHLYILYWFRPFPQTRTVAMIFISTWFPLSIDLWLGDPWRSIKKTSRVVCKYHIFTHRISVFQKPFKKPGNLANPWVHGQSMRTVDCRIFTQTDQWWPMYHNIASVHKLMTTLENPTF